MKNEYNEGKCRIGKYKKKGCITVMLVKKSEFTMKVFNLL